MTRTLPRTASSNRGHGPRAGVPIVAFVIFVVGLVGRGVALFDAFVPTFVGEANFFGFHGARAWNGFS